MNWRYDKRGAGGGATISTLRAATLLLGCLLLYACSSATLDKDVPERAYAQAEPPATSGILAEMAGRQKRQDRPVTLHMSREDIADYLGLNTDSVSRILSRIRKSGLFRFTSTSEYTVPDAEAVARRLPVALPDHNSPHSAGGSLS